MKKIIFVLFIYLTAILKVEAQESVEALSKFSIIAYGGIGYGQVVNEKEPNYDLHSNTAEVLLNYKLWKKFGLAAGVGYTELSGNGFNATGDFYQDRLVLKIPVLFTINTKVSDNINVFGTVGPYAQTLTKDDYHYIDHIEKDVYNGWNFGVQFGFGVAFKVDKNLSLGVFLDAQSDISTLKTNETASIIDEQKLKNLTTVGLIFEFNL